MSKKSISTILSIKNRLFKPLKVVVSAILILWVLTLVDLRTLIIAIRKVNLGFFSIAFFSVILTHFVTCIRWKYCLLEISDRFSFLNLLVPYWKSMFVGMLLPTEYGGDIIKIQYLWNKLENNKLAIASVFWARISGVLSAFMLLIFTSLLFHERYSFINKDILLIIIVLLILAFVILLILKSLQESSISPHLSNSKETAAFNWWSKISDFYTFPNTPA